MRDRHIDGRALRELRERSLMRQPELAERSGISLSYLKEIEGLAGRPPRQPSGLVAYAIARALGVDISEFSTSTNDEVAA